MKTLYGANITLFDSLVITVLSLGIVFAILSIIAFILSQFKHISKDAVKTIESKNSKNVVVKEKIKTQEGQKLDKIDSNSITDENMIVAMLIATIEASEEIDGAYVKVRSIKELN